MIQDYVIHKFIRERGGKASKQEVFEALGIDEETRGMIEGKLRMMERSGFVMIDGDTVEMK